MTAMHHLAVAVVLFVLGAVLGSFLNVCAHRIPLGLGVLRPASRCPRCGAAVSPRDNVPVLGWLLLRGRCRGCGGAISPRYPAVEAAVGLLMAAPYLLAAIEGRGDPLDSGPAWIAWRLADALALSGFLVVGVLIAVDTGTVPTRVASAGIVAALLLAAARPPAGVAGAPDGLGDASAGLLVGVGAAMLASRIGHRAGRPGDAAFAAMVGALVGARAIVPVLAIAAAIALVAPALADRRRPAGGGGGRSALPPGVALGLAGLVLVALGMVPGAG